MIRDDFRCMRRGLPVAMMNDEDAKLLAGVHLSNGKKNKALLMMHGFASTPAVFRHLLLGIKGYDALVAPSLPKHSVSLAEFSEFKAALLTEFAEETYNKLSQEFDEVHVLGLSLGGLLASHLSQRFTLPRLFLLAPALDLHLALDSMLKLATLYDKLGFCYLRNMAGNLYSDTACEIALRQLPIPAIIELFQFIKAFRFAPPNCPTDIFLGRHDEVVASHCVAERFDSMSSVDVHWLENSAHLLPLDGDFEKIIQQVNSVHNAANGTANKLSPNELV